MAKKNTDGTTSYTVDELVDSGYNFDKSGSGQDSRSAIQPYKTTSSTDGTYSLTPQTSYTYKTVEDYTPTNLAKAANTEADNAALASIESQSRPTLAASSDRPTLADSGSRPTSDALTALASSGRPTLADSGERPTSEKLTALEEQSRPTYTGSYDEQISQLLNDIYNRGSFTYNYNEDPLYQQYAESYTQNAKKAMKDSQAAASALTGGYGSTYATQAGQQAYDSYMQQLSNEIPSLYQIAADRYDTETSNLNNKLSTFNNQDAIDYNRYRDQNTDYESDRNYYYNKWLADNSNYDTDRTFDYNKWVQDNSNYNTDWSNAYTKWAADNSNYDTDRTYNYNVWNAENSNYDTDRTYDYNVWNAENSNYDTDRNYYYEKTQNDQAQENYLTELYQQYHNLDPNYEVKTVKSGSTTTYTVDGKSTSELDKIAASGGSIAGLTAGQAAYIKDYKEKFGENS